MFLIIVMALEPPNTFITNNVPLNNTYSNNATYQNFTCTIATENPVNQTIINMSLYFNGVLNTTNKTEVLNNTAYNFSLADMLADGNYEWDCEVCVNDTISPCRFSSNFTLIIDTTFPQINFTPPTPDNNSIISMNYTIINMSIEELNLEESIFNWNGTNFTIYNDSLVLMYNFDNISSLGENNSYIVDMSQSNNDGEWQNTTTLINYTEGRYGHGIQFDGMDDYLNVTNPSNLDFDARGYTISMWVNFKDTDDVYLFDSRTGKAGEYGYYAIAQSYDIFFGQQDSTGATNSQKVGIVNGNLYDGWHHLTFRRNGTTIYDYNIFFDGEMGYRNTYSNIGDSSDITISNLVFGAKYNHDDYFNGTMDEIRIWNYSLSTEEVRQQYYSNLQRYDSGSWNLYINQSAQSDGNYTYYGCAEDMAGNINCTDESTIRKLTVDAMPPIISSLVNKTTDDGTSSFYPDDNIYCNSTITDIGTAVDTVIFAFNMSDGTWHNITVISTTSLYSSNITSANISDAGGKWLAWRYYANDTTGNIGEGDITNYFVNVLPSEAGAVSIHQGGTGLGSLNITQLKETASTTSDYPCPTDLPFFKRLFSNCKVHNNDICDDGEWFLLNFDCALDEYIFYQMWFFRLILVISLIMLIRNSSYFPFAAGFVVLLLYMNHILF